MLFRQVSVVTVLGVSLVAAPSLYAAIYADSALNVNNVAVRPPVLIAGGYARDQATSHQSPLVVVSGDGGAKWQLASVCHDGELSYISAVDCTGNSDRSICVAAGADDNQPGNNPNSEVLYVSRDRGVSWARMSSAGWPGGAFYYSASCTGSVNKARCAVVGKTLGDSPILSVSTDGGLSWATKDLSFLPYSSGYLGAIDCVGRGASAICVSVGRVGDAQGNRALAVAVSHDGGDSWMHSSSVPVSRSELHAVSCIPNGTSAACVAVGGGEEGSLLMNSFDGGMTWTQRSGPPTFPTSLEDVSCTGRAGRGVCVVVGSNFLFSSMDSGSTLTRQTVPGMSELVHFQHASCTGSGSQAICAVLSRDFSNGQQYLAVSQYGPANWSLKSIPGMSATVELNSVHCEGVREHAVCTVAGVDVANHAPFMAQSTNGGVDWQVVHVADMPEEGALLAASSNGLKKASKAQG